MLPIPEPDRTATGRSIRDDLKNFNFTISGPSAGEHKEVVFFPKLMDAGRPDVTKVPGFPKDYHYVQGVSH